MGANRPRVFKPASAGSACRRRGDDRRNDGGAADRDEAFTELDMRQAFDARQSRTGVDAVDQCERRNGAARDAFERPYIEFDCHGTAFVQAGRRTGKRAAVW